MVEKSLTIKSVEPLLLFGSNDTHLKRIESTFQDTKVIARGDKIVLKGNAKDVDKVEEVIGELVSLLGRNTHLTANDVDTVLSLVKRDEPEKLISHSPDVVIVNSASVGQIKPKTPGQVELYEASLRSDVCFAVGPAGTGKTYLAVAIAVSQLKSKRVKKIVLSRPAVEAGESLGFLPGDLKEKVDPYLTPLYDALKDMIPREKLRLFFENNTVEIVPLAYMRGRTLNDSFVILDEAQNATSIQMKMFLTRLGENSKAIITGDMTQTDLPSHQKSGLGDARRVLSHIDGIEFVQFGSNDVVRHPLVRKIIDAYDNI